MIMCAEYMPLKFTGDKCDRRQWVSDWISGLRCGCEEVGDAVHEARVEVDGSLNRSC